MEQTMTEQVFANVDLSGITTGVLAIVAVSISLAIGFAAWKKSKSGIRQA